MRCGSRSDNRVETLSVGLISDTHGLLRAEALEALRGSGHIVHAGDVGDPAVLEALARIAPVVAGHSHRPGKDLRDGVLYLNPGSAGPRRFKLPVAVDRLALPACSVVFEML